MHFAYNKCSNTTLMLDVAQCDIVVIYGGSSGGNFKQHFTFALSPRVSLLGLSGAGSSDYSELLSAVRERLDLFPQEQILHGHLPEPDCKDIQYCTLQEIYYIYAFGFFFYFGIMANLTERVRESGSCLRLAGWLAMTLDFVSFKPVVHWLGEPM